MTRGDDAAPDVVNGDGDRTGYSVVEVGTHQAFADVKGKGAPLSGYVSPSVPPTPSIVVIGEADRGVGGDVGRLLGLVGRHGRRHRLEHLGGVLLDV